MYSISTDNPPQAARRAVTSSAISIVPSDMLLFAAVALLPVDGTRLGPSLPYWTPLSPWLFAAFTLWNWRYLRDTIRRFLPFFLFPLLLLATSLYGWMTVGVQPIAALKSLGSILLALACLSSLDIAFRQKHLPLRPILTTLFTTYLAAFLVGVLQWMALPAHMDWLSVRSYFYQILFRTYSSVRPQFLFAEPSYIGMHLFGVLLPVYWMTRDRRIGCLIPVFAAGAIALGSGTRIVLDSIVAFLLWMVATINFRSKAAAAGFIGGMSAIVIAGAGAALFHPRLHALLTQGILAGDYSMSARIFHTLAPMWAWKHDVAHALFGWGAGNISEAVRTGYEGARQWYDAHGGAPNLEIDELANPPVDTFTMSAYTSFITEFGALCFLALAAMLLTYISTQHAWTRRMVCMVLLTAYLYLQFEAYAFYTIPLLILMAAYSKSSGQREESNPSSERQRLPDVSNGSNRETD